MKSKKITPLVALIALQDAMEHYGYEASFEEQQAVAKAYFMAQNAKVLRRGIDIYQMRHTPINEVMERPEAYIEGCQMLDDDDIGTTLKALGYEQVEW